MTLGARHRALPRCERPRAQRLTVDKLEDPNRRCLFGVGLANPLPRSSKDFVGGPDWLRQGEGWVTISARNATIRESQMKRIILPVLVLSLLGITAAGAYPTPRTEQAGSSELLVEVGHKGKGKGHGHNHNYKHGNKHGY